MSASEDSVWNALGYHPTPKQREFHDLSLGRLGAVLFGGGKGVGKTTALLMDAIRFAATRRDARVVLVRRTYHELTSSLLVELDKRGYAQALGASWNKTLRELRFPNGSTISFTYCETVADSLRIPFSDYVGIDHAALLLPDVLTTIERCADKLRLAAAPGGPSQEYLFSRFLGNNLSEDAFVSARVSDGPLFPKEEDHEAKGVRESIKNWDCHGQKVHTWASDGPNMAPILLEIARWLDENYGTDEPAISLHASYSPDGSAEVTITYA